MNLHSVVRQAITSVTPDIAATYLRSTGNTVDGAGIQTPSFVESDGVLIQVQALSASELQLLPAEYLSIENVLRAVYLYGNAQGIVRANSKGGDLLLFAQTPIDVPQTWKTIQVLETWADWSKIAVCLQTDIRLMGKAISVAQGLGALSP